MLSGAWSALSWLAIVSGAILAVLAPNGALGVILCLLGMFSLWGWLEHKEETEMTHTSNLRYSRWERFVFRLTGRWPYEVVVRRLVAHDMDVMEAKERALRNRVERDA